MPITFQLVAIAILVVSVMLAVINGDIKSASYLVLLAIAVSIILGGLNL